MDDSVVRDPCDFSPSSSSLTAWSLQLPETRSFEFEEIDAFMRARQHQLSSQILTPPTSDTGSESVLEREDHSHNNNVSNDVPSSSVSATFHVAANLLSTPPDLALISTDGIVFHAHTTQLLSVSTNHFKHLILPNNARSSGVDTVACVPEPAAVLNVVLHSAYEISCARYNHSLDTLIAAVDAMPSYGISPQTHLRPLFDLILALAPMQPLAVYSLASRHDLHSLAQPVSSHLLSFRLDTLTDDLASRMAGTYLTKLFLLHMTRLDTLKQLLRPAPQLHPCTPDCDFVEQKKLARAWVLAAGYLGWEARADVSPGAIEDALSSLAPRLSCGLCRVGLAARIKDVIDRWSSVKRTI